MGHFFYHLWYGYFWPSDLGNGPEALQQTAVYAFFAAVFVPAIRHYLEKREKAIHAKLDHIIFHHPDIPPFEEKP